MSYVDKNKKVEFGLRNLYFAEQTVGPDQLITNGTPESIPGAIHITMNAVGDKSELYADDRVYYSEENNEGFDGEIELATVSTDFRTKYLGDVKTKDGVVYEVDNPKKPQILMIFEVKNDQGSNKLLIHGVKLGRPSEEVKTNEKGKSYKTFKVPFSASPVEIASGDRITKGVVTPAEAIYANLYTTPYAMPTDLEKNV